MRLISAFFSFLKRRTELEIMPLGPDQIEACARIHQLSFAKGWSQNEFYNLLHDRNIIANYVRYLKSKRMCGFILSRRAADEAEVVTIAINPDDRRRGMANGLLQQHIKDLALMNVQRLFLEVDKNNHAAMKLYEKSGFIKVGERKAYYQNTVGKDSSAYIMRKDIH